MRIWYLSLTLTALGFLLPSSAQAQPQAPGAPGGGAPAFSPYLNLLRGGGGGGPALNYFGLVRPQQQMMQQANSLQQQINQTGQQLNGINNAIAGADPTLPVTGRGARFGFYSHYYPSLGGGGGAGSIFGSTGMGRLGGGSGNNRLFGSQMANIGNLGGGGGIGSIQQGSALGQLSGGGAGAAGGRR